MEKKTNKLQKISHILEVTSSDEFKESFKLCKNQFFVILNKVLPKKWKLKAHFGFDDPAVTGQIIEAVAPIYPFVYDHVDLQPDFDNQIVEANISAKGKLRLITLVICGLRIILNKQMRKTIKLLRGNKNG